MRRLERCQPRQQPQPQPPVGAGNPPTGTGPTVAINAGQNPAGQKPSEVGTKPAPAVKPSEVKGETPAADPGDRKGRKDRDRGDKSAKGRDTKSDRPDKDPTPTAPPPTRVDTPPPVEPKKPAKAKKPDDLDALLDSASSGSSGKPRAEATKKDAPEQLSMDMIKSGLKSVSGSAQACGTPGTYMVKLTIGPSGRVSDASVPGKSGDAGADCVAKEMTDEQLLDQVTQLLTFAGEYRGMSDTLVILRRTLGLGVDCAKDTIVAKVGDLLGISYNTAAGYVIIAQDCRGRGKSGGEWEPFVHEPEDGFDTQEWVGRQL